MKDHTQLVRDLLRRGVEIRQSGSGHLKAKIDGGETIVIPLSPGAGRSHENAVAELRRAGILERPEGGGGPRRGKRPEVPPKLYDGPFLPEGRIPRRRSISDERD